MNSALEHRVAQDPQFLYQHGRKFSVSIRNNFSMSASKEEHLLTENVIRKFTLSQDDKIKIKTEATSTRAPLSYNKFDSLPSVLSNVLDFFWKQNWSLIAITYRYRVLTEPMMESIYIYALFPFDAPRFRNPLHQNLHKVSFHRTAICLQNEC